MYALIRGRWSDTWLDEPVGPRELRIQVSQWDILAPIPGAYFVRNGSLHFLLGQLRRLGLVDMIRKIRSRVAERGRNERWLVTGSGQVVSLGSEVSGIQLGASLRFVAPRHPAGMERVVLHEDLCRPAGRGRSGRAANVIALRTSPSQSATTASKDSFEGLAGWHPASGQPAPDALIDRCLAVLPTGPAVRYVGTSPVATCRGGKRDGSRRSGKSRPRLLVVGYGNYAKTVAIPLLSRFLELVAVCDIDPFQIPPADSGVFWTTSLGQVDPQRIDVVLVAGYHHTHAQVAMWALAHNKDVIIEKPIFTTAQQLATLREALTSSDARVFVGFQRRHSPFNRFLKSDLPANSPRDYHCVVFEEQLPGHHWYRWPNSGGRLVANGCHWIDHFLFINAGSPVIASHVEDLGLDRLGVSLRLQNSAAMTMTLTSTGSPRLGMRDYIEIRSGTVTVRIGDSARYEAERLDRLVRRRSIAPLAAHHAMYRDFGARIVSGAPGDRLELAIQSGLVTISCSEMYSIGAGGP